MRALSQLRQDIQGSPDLARDLSREIDAITRDMQRITPNQLAGNPAVLDKLVQGQVLPSVQQLELLLRRKLDDKAAGEVRSGGAERVPAGYGDAVAEYFRRLSKGSK
jgi:hypothetical protein